MNAMAALKQYQTVNTQAQAIEASPHRLIQMLMEGGLTRLAQARGAMERGQTALKGELISKAIGIIGELRASLDHAAGGDISRDLDRLYEFVLDQLSQANLQRSETSVNAAIEVMRTLKEGWDGIVPV